MTFALQRALPWLILCRAITATAGDQPSGVPSPGGAPAAKSAHVHIEDAACWPSYPEEFRAVGVGGRSTIRLSVDAGGVVQHVYIEAASGPTPAHRILDTRAATALAACRIDAARDAQGRPTPGDALVTWTWEAPIASATDGHASASGAATIGMPPIPLLSSRECRQVDYPAAAVRQHATGVTKLRVDVDADGRVLGSTVVRAAGSTRAHHLLDDATRSLVANCPFRPALDEGGTPVASPYEFTFTWRLE